jgi:hypothetical protein
MVVEDGGGGEMGYRGSLFICVVIVPLGSFFGQTHASPCSVVLNTPTRSHRNTDRMGDKLNQTNDLQKNPVSFHPSPIPFNGAIHPFHPTEIEGSLTSQLSTLIQKNGFLCQKIETLQRNNTDLEYKFSITNSELERARREYSELHAKYELRSANYKDLKDVCYQLDAQLNKKNGVAPEESFLSRIELNSDRKKRRMSVDIADDDSDSGGGGNGNGGYVPYDETAPAEGSMVAPNSRAMMPLPVAAAVVTAQRALSPPTSGPTQSTWTCLWKNCNQVFNALDWLVGHVEEFHIGLGKVRFSFTLSLPRVTSENTHAQQTHTTRTYTDIRNDPFATHRLSY